MHIVLVHIHVKPEMVESFRLATLQNARSSMQEPGVARFDVIQQKDDPTQFILVEVYAAPEDQLKHRGTSHYAVWRDAVAEMMSEPRQGVSYLNVFPDDSGWSC